MTRNLCAYTALAVCLAAPLAAADVRGEVTDPSGAVVQGALVRLLDGDRTVRQTRSGSRGEFVLATPEGAPRSGAWRLAAEANGFEPVTQNVEKDSPNVRLVLALAPYRASVEVRSVTPMNQAEIDMSGLRESPARDLGEALAALDGVTRIRKAGIANDVVVRGLQQNNINVLIDGARIYGACPAHMDPPAQHVDFAEVDRVEVNKGAFDVTNQGSLGAVVNIVTKSPGLGFQVRPSLSLGSFGYYNPSLTVSYGNPRFRVLGGYSYRTSRAYTDGSGRRFTDYAAYSAAGRDRHAFDLHTGWMQLEFKLTDRQQLSLNYTRQQAGMILYPYLSMDGDADNADRGGFKYSATGLGSTVRNVRVEGYFTQVKHFMSDSQRVSAMGGAWMMASDASTRTMGGRVETDLGRNLTAGVESYQREWNLTGYMKMNGMMMVNPSIPDVATTSVGAYATWQRQLTERLRVEAGARFDHAAMRVQNQTASTNLYAQFHGTRRTSNDDNYASGNARLAWTLPGSSELFAGFGTTGRLPDAQERYISRGMGTGAMVGDPSLPITRNREWSAGWSLHRDRFTLRPLFFYSFLDNYILVNKQMALMSGGMMMATNARSFTNIDARFYGGELSYHTKLTDKLSLDGGGSYTRGIADLRPAANVNSRNLPEMPPLRGWSALRYTHRWAFAEINTTASNRQSLVSSDLGEVPTAGYALLGLKLGFTVRRVSASFSLDNLLNRFYYENLSYYRDPFSAGVKVPEPGRNAFAQIRYSF
ncbi:TonB-dependent receptor domain-containing protein [uncultured Paludibaculum sp.]|uniref:TonB-dependent receptor n=1 Tax=uncultured Paludibaculum sp. TaxID=1765020 RepID=UPI002AAC2C07|nr:TonB-dependent receptor [uncultured Paludibaculum sp.]